MPLGRVATSSRNAYPTPGPGFRLEVPSSSLPRTLRTHAGEGFMFCGGSWARGEGHLTSGTSKIPAEEPARQRGVKQMWESRPSPWAAVPSSLPGGGLTESFLVSHAVLSDPPQLLAVSIHGRESKQRGKGEGAAEERYRFLPVSSAKGG